ncbi:DUF3987 domain-containing protein [Bacillus sp. B190/17]|uniref:DUF3987 domain-containing protein n=1 Tax=Bacillus lumedeiriae TaxID=3058829 RepID=A0ABW8IDU2_9BACI
MHTLKQDKSNVLPTFPLESLPKPLADFIKETAECNAGTTDGVGLGVIIALGTAIGNSAEILIDGVPEGWVESTLLWGAYVADPGSNKSGITTAGMKPLKKIQKENYELYKAQYEEYEDMLDEYKQSQQNRKKSGAELLPKPIEPKFKQIIVNYSTLEGLSGVLVDNPRGVIALFDELRVFMEQMDMYRGGNGGDLAKWLSIFVRDEFTINLASKRPRHISLPFVAVHGNITPDKLNLIITKVQDGLADRFLFVYPEKVLPYYNPNIVDPKLQEGYERIIDRLLNLHTDLKTPLQVRYSSDAKTLWNLYHDYLISITEQSDFPKRLEGVFNKFRGIFSRIVLILHLTKFVCHETAKNEFVDIDTVEQAFKLVLYFIAHAKKVYNVVDKNDMDIKIEMIQEFINKRGEDYIDEGVPDWRGKIITINDMNKYRVFSPKYETKKLIINEVLAEMQEQGLGHTMEFQSTGTKPIRKFLLFSHPINM